MTQNPNTTPDITSSAWGFAHPDCRGAAALVFFTDDLARVVNQYLGTGQVSDEALADAQKAVDALLQRYVELQTAPEAFTGQRVLLQLETEQLPDGSLGAYVALKMSPEFESLIIEAQKLASERGTKH